jgi:hypothetical protein
MPWGQRPGGQSTFQARASQPAISLVSVTHPGHRLEVVFRIPDIGEAALAREVARVVVSVAHVGDAVLAVHGKDQTRRGALAGVDGQEVPVAVVAKTVPAAVGPRGRLALGPTSPEETEPAEVEGPHVAQFTFGPGGFLCLEAPQHGSPIRRTVPEFPRGLARRFG